MTCTLTPYIIGSTPSLPYFIYSPSPYTWDSPLPYNLFPHPLYHRIHPVPSLLHLFSHPLYHRIRAFPTSSSSLSRWNLSSWRAMPLRVTIRAAPPHRLGRVSNFHCSVKTPALGDLKTNGNFMVSPGKITPLKI